MLIDVDSHLRSLAGFCRAPVWSNPLFLSDNIEFCDDQADGLEDVDDENDRVDDHEMNLRRMSNWSPKYGKHK